ncbi:TetR/AcrR family transcriptional regulator [Microbacterium sp. NC79]|uniref:TetR/AcrR family transcriptional regulator n=1 Tax=Microbacterium sp. NC79 TaxID=2851009 RepID=UPI001C2CB748|nr:TetR/AcrR family transcriptional regulator [Microbacterium sp. NC79]MBV0895738.1 TetR/AcrR family transcriptional regulator [Microbacterium sp. NC79]
MPVGTRTRNDQSSERRDQIMAIAAHLIARRGYSATTVRDIADEAGILSGSLYHHFSSKEAILQEILRNFMATLLAKLERIQTEESDPRVQLDRLIAVAFETIEQQPDAVGLYQQESAFLSTVPGFEFLTEESNRIETIWISALVAGQNDGVFREELDPALSYRFIRDAVWSTVRWFRPGGRHTAESLTNHLLNLLHAGLLAD